MWRCIAKFENKRVFYLEMGYVKGGLDIIRETVIEQ